MRALVLYPNLFIFTNFEKKQKNIPKAMSSLASYTTNYVLFRGQKQSFSTRYSINESNNIL